MINFLLFSVEYECRPRPVLQYASERLKINSILTETMPNMFGFCAKFRPIWRRFADLHHRARRNSNRLTFQSFSDQFVVLFARFSFTLTSRYSLFPAQLTVAFAFCRSIKVGGWAFVRKFFDI